MKQPLLMTAPQIIGRIDSVSQRSRQAEGNSEDIANFSFLLISGGSKLTVRFLHWHYDQSSPIGPSMTLHPRHISAHESEVTCRGRLPRGNTPSRLSLLSGVLHGVSHQAKTMIRLMGQVRSSL